MHPNSAATIPRSRAASPDALPALVAARILGRRQDRRAIPALRAMQARSIARHDADFAQVCASVATTALAALGEPDALAKIAHDLASSAPATRFQALEQAATTGRRELVGAVAALLDDRRHPSVSGESVEADEAYGWRICDAAACALALIEPQAFFTPPENREDLPLRHASDQDIRLWKEWIRTRGAARSEK